LWRPRPPGIANGLSCSGAAAVARSGATEIASEPSASARILSREVPSAVAADLMIDFYRRWLHAGPDTWFAKAEALRRARLHLLRDGKHHDPYYWSGYVLIGSGR